MKITLTRVTNDPILAIEEAASNCYDSTPSPDGKIMNHCIRSGHTSVTEFLQFTFHIEGVSRALLAQLTRHRHAGYAVRSQRYCSEDGFGYVVPPSIKKNEDAYDSYLGMMQTIQEWYQELQEYGIPNEDARMVLPNACETVIEVTMNMRALMNFFNERLCTCAQWEIREAAKKMRDLAVESVPQTAPYFVPKCEKYGKEFGFCTEPARRSCGRHPRLAEIFEDYHNYKDMCNS